MKSPNWNEEELKLALELYISHDLEWLCRTRSDTEEIVALSEILNHLDYHDVNGIEKFRSPGAIRMKLANFMQMDERYTKRSLSNLGNADKRIWKIYHDDPEKLKKECVEIIETHFIGKKRIEVTKYIQNHFLKPGRKETDIVTQFIDTVIGERLPEKEKKECYDKIADIISQYRLVEEQYKEHAGINQKPIDNKEIKIGKLVQSSIERMIDNKELSEQQIELFLSKNWSRNVFHIGHPFFKEITKDLPMEEQLKDCNGYTRYWKKIYPILGHDYAMCKEWFEANRKHFLRWSENPGEYIFADDGCVELQRLLRFIKECDKRDYVIRLDELKEQFPEYQSLDKTIEKLQDADVIKCYQGSQREYTVDDYEALYKLIEKPEGLYLKEKKNEAE